MTVQEAVRQYQTTLEAVRTLEDHGGGVDDDMRMELACAERAMDTAWLEHVARLTG